MIRILLLCCLPLLATLSAADYKSSRSRSATQGIFIIGVGSTDRDILRYNPLGGNNGKKVIKAKGLTYRGSTAAEKLDSHRILIAGGRPETKLTEIYDTKTKKVKKAADLPRSVSRPGSAFLNGRVYIAGGESSSRAPAATAAAECFRYNSKEDRWETRGKMIRPRNDFALISHQGQLYAVGGMSKGHSVFDTDKTMEVYNEDTNTWTSLDSKLPAGIHNHAGASFDGKLYVSGGNGEGKFYRKQTYVYNTASKTWTQGPDLKTGRAGHSMVVFADRLYVIGGVKLSDKSGLVSLKSVEVLSEDGTEWLPAKDLPEPTASAPVVAFHHSSS